MILTLKFNHLGDVLVPHNGELLPIKESHVPYFAQRCKVVERHEDERLTVDFMGKLIVNKNYRRKWNEKKYLLLED